MTEPLPPGWWKPADTDRQHVAERLLYAVDEGRLDLDEYERRLRASEQAGTLQELERVVADLPFPPEEALTRIGDISVTATTIHTPEGLIPMRGSQWTLQDRWRLERKIPNWAIALAIVLFFCIGPFSLLFLLKRDDVFQGHVQVTVVNGGRRYVTYLPVHSRAQLRHLHQQLDYVRSLAGR